MKKKIFSLMLALMICLFATNALAIEYKELPKEVDVKSTTQVRLNGTDADWASGSTITMSTQDMAGSVDFKVTLATDTIRDTIKDWYQYGTDLIAEIAGSNSDLKNSLTAKIGESPVTGNFTVTIKYPSQFEVPSEHIENSKKLVGFNDTVSNLFEETSRNYDETTSTLTIEIAIKEGITESNLIEGIDEGLYLDELTYTIEGVKTGTFTNTVYVKGNMSGETYFRSGSDPKDDVVEFKASEAKATLRPKSTPSVGGSVATEYKITFNIDGDTSSVSPMYESGTVKASDLPAPTKAGYTFDGWYTDSAMKTKVADSFKISKNTTLYGHWISNTLVTEEHYAYILGYPDETVRPNNNITREEAATMFYRLLRDEVREEYYTTENDFSDIAEERWSNSAISTMANGGYVVGRTDGTFDPEAPITRAEFAAMAVRFASLMDTSGASFSDIEGHWAEKYILKAATAGWVSGRTDGTFDPNAYITRAEAMTLVNNVLMRHVNKEGLHEDARIWVDIKGDEWFYYIVLEATNSHDYTRQEDGYNETWTEILPNKEWK